MFLTLAAAVHGGLSAGVNFMYIFQKGEENHFKIRLPIELRFGYRFFVKGIEGLFVDPVLTYYTAYGLRDNGEMHWMFPFKNGSIPGIQLRIGKSWKDKKISVYGLLDVINLSYSNILAGISLGAGFEWGFSSYASLAARIKLGVGANQAFDIEAVSSAGASGEVPIAVVTGGGEGGLIGGSVTIGIEVHSSKYYG